MAQKNTQEQPIWVQDLLAWLDHISSLELNGEEWVTCVEEVLAELPGQGLPDEIWEKAKAGDDTATEDVEDEKEDIAELEPLTNEKRVEIEGKLAQGECIQMRYDNQLIQISR